MNRIGDKLRNFNEQRLLNCFAISKLYRNELTEHDIAFNCVDFDKNTFFAYFEFDLVELPV